MNEAKLLIDERVCIFAPLKLWSYWTEVHQILYDVARISQMNASKSDLRYSTPFWNGKAMNEGESADFAHFESKIGCHRKSHK